MTIPGHHQLDGIPLLPRPTTDAKDPLRWPRWLKILALISTALFNFTGNFAAAGLSVAVPVFVQEFHKTGTEINSLLSFNFLMLGLGNLFWVPLAQKFGKRFSLLVAMIMLFAVLVGTAKAPNYDSLLALRCLSGFASAAGESIVPSVVADIFFLHERAATMSIYVILIAGSSALGPLVAAFMVQYTADTWRGFVWLCAALAGLNVLALFLFYPESNFDRTKAMRAMLAEHEGGTSSNNDKPDVDNSKDVPTAHFELASQNQQSLRPVHTVDHIHKPWTSIWFSVVTVNHDENLFKMFLRPLRYLAFPSVIWAIALYGSTLASQIIITYAFPSFLMAPPYFFSSVDVGLMQIAALIGIVFGCITGGYLADVITARAILRRGGKVFPEQRMLAMIPFGWIPPVGCIVIAFACSQHLTWVAIAFGFGMVSFGTVYAPNIAVTYVVEKYPRYAGEALITINVLKNLVAFLFLYEGVQWVDSQGWVQVYMIMFMLLTLCMIAAAAFYVFRTKKEDSTEASDTRAASVGK